MGRQILLASLFIFTSHIVMNIIAYLKFCEPCDYSNKVIKGTCSGVLKMFYERKL